MYRLLPLLFFVAGCNFSPAIGDLTCDTEGATRDGQRCEGGFWVGDPDGLLDVGPDDRDLGPNEDDDVRPQPQDVGPTDDVSTSDATTPDDVSTNDDAGDTDPMCVPESKEAFCARYNAVCGPLTKPDNCQNTRTEVPCGACSGGATCEDNACMCPPGQVLDGATCVPDCDDTCDDNATCQVAGNVARCECDSGYVGDGLTCNAQVRPSVVATYRDTAGGMGDLETSSISHVEDDLYVAFIAVNGGASVSVEGMGLSWNRVVDGACSAARTRKLDVWYARGVASGSDGPFEADISGGRTDSAVVVYHIRDAGTGGSHATNNGRSNCGGTVVDAQSTYSYQYAVEQDNSLLIAATAVRNNHNVGAGWTAGRTADRSRLELATMTMEPTTRDVTVAGTMEASNWVSAVVEIFSN